MIFLYFIILIWGGITASLCKDGGAPTVFVGKAAGGELFAVHTCVVLQVRRAR